MRVRSPDLAQESTLLPIREPALAPFDVVLHPDPHPYRFARMDRMIGSRAAANTLIVLFSLALIFQVVVLLGFIPIEMIWGGRLRGEQERIYGALVSIAVLLIMIAIVLIRRGVIGRSLPIVGRWGIWVVGVVFALNTVGNLLAWDTRETLIFTPITLLATLLAWRVAKGE